MTASPGPSTAPPVAPRATPRLVATLLGSSLVGRMPQAMSALALVKVVLDAGGDYAAAGALTTAYVLASTAGAPVLSRVIDRTGRLRPTLLVAALVSAAAFVAVVATVRTSFPLAFVAVLVAGVAAPPLEPALRGRWPVLAGSGAELQRLFAADTAAQEVLFILGPLVTVGAAAVAGAAGAVLVMAALAVLGTAAFAAHRVVGVPTAAAGTHAGGSALRVRAVPPLVAALVLAGLPIGVLTITCTRVAALAGAPSLAGWGLAVNAAGALLGALAAARSRSSVDPVASARRLLPLLGVAYLPTALLQAPAAVWLPLVLLSGAALPPLLTRVFAVVAARVPAAVATEANAWVVSAFNVGIGAGTLAAAALTGAAGSAGTVAAVVGASVLAAAGTLVLLALPLDPRR